MIKRHILYLHQYFATPDSNGGTRSYELARRLVRSGHTVTVITSSAFLPKNWSLPNMWNYRELEGIRLIILKLPYSNKMSFFRRIGAFLRFSFYSTVKAFKVKVDLIFATSTPLTIAIPAVLASKKSGAPLVFEVRDLWPELPIAVGALKSPVIIWVVLNM